MIVILQCSKARSILYSGGGGSWKFCLGREIFFGQNRSKIIFSPALRAGLFFFVTKSYIYDKKFFRDINFTLNSGFRNNFMLNSSFRDNLILEYKAFAPNSHSIQVFATTAVGTTRQLHSQLNSRHFHTQIDMPRLCEHHSLIIQNSLYIIISHSNCEIRI